VEDISISPKAVRLIAEGPIDENWVKALNEVEARSASIENSSGSSVKALDDVKPLLADLKNKVLSTGIVLHTRAKENAGYRENSRPFSCSDQSTTIS
jgi:hypothetical protein